MSTGAKVLHNSLILLALGAAVPAAWAASAQGTSTALNIPIEIPAKPPTPRVLDLRPPDIHEVMSADELAAAIPNPEETEVVGPEAVVHGESPAPYVPGGFAALYWATTHPAGAWRILAPVQ